jgi:GGDEF domain-containing protein
VAFYPQDGTSAEQLLAEADRKMYVTKKIHYEHHERSLPACATEHPISVMVN